MLLLSQCRGYFFQPMSNLPTARLQVIIINYIKQKPPTFCNKQGTLYVGVRLNFSLVVKMATDIAMTQEAQCNLREQCIA